MTLEEGNDVWHDEVEIPDDDDPRDAAGIDVALEALLDRTMYLFRALLVAGHDVSLLNVTAVSVTAGAFTLNPPLTVTRQVPLTPIMDDWSAGGWVQEGLAASNLPSYFRYTNTTEMHSWILLPLSSVVPTAATFTGFSVKAAAGASAPSLPTGADRMQAAIFRQSMTNMNDDQFELVGAAANDASANLTNYRAKHALSGTLSEETDEGYQYYLGLKSDSNGYGQIYQATITFTAALILPGGA
jgi:hypothetical protein